MKPRQSLLLSFSNHYRNESPLPKIPQTVQVPTPAPKLLLTVEEAARCLSVGRTLMYALVMRKQIVSIKVGRSRRIPVAALHEFVTRELGQQQDEGGTV